VPSDLAAAQYRNVITDEITSVVHSAGESWILLGEAFATAPLALLVRED
jgi:hypothetical protein